MKQRGFTLIELMVVFVVIAIFIMIAIPAITGSASMSSGKVTWGVNGMTESRCIEGYKFVVGQEGQARQILDEFGKGVRCELQSKPGSFGSMQ